MKRRSIGAVLLGVMVVALTATPVCMAAVKKSGGTTTKQSAIQKGTTVRTKVEAKGIYDQECYDAYYGCMDQFCITDNSNGGSCACSDANEKYEKQLADIQKMLTEAERIRTIEVEKVKAGAQADIIFTGERRYDENGNIIKVGEVSDADKKKQRLDSWFDNLYDDEDDEDVDVTDLRGNELFVAAEEICVNQIPAKCDKDLNFLHQVYARQITSDCKGFENSLAEKKFAAEMEMAQAEGDVRTAMVESLESANKYDQGQCMLEFKKCMLTDDACGPDWANCVSAVASENMQNNEATSTAGTKVKSSFKSNAEVIAKTGGQVENSYGIAMSTLERLDAKRIICEHVLNECVAVRDSVWPAFLREAAPTIKIAESKVESTFRTSCLRDISDCIQKACKDDIAGKGIDTMDACLARPDMVRSFCKVEIDPCERMEPQIFAYVKDKLAAMRVDACTQEVKDCFTDENRCGPDFRNCIGMDFEFIHDICPIDKLVVCKQANPNFSMDDLDSMLMGLYLNVDNAALAQCQEIVDKKMAEICGSTTDCNKFAADEFLGTGSLRTQKDGNKYRVTGMISFGSIKMGTVAGNLVKYGSVNDNNTAGLQAGEIGITDYLKQVKSRNAGVPDSSAIITTIEEELNNIAGTINRTIEMIESDPQVQYCVSGRNLGQITGDAKAHTKGRFPNLLSQVKMQIAVAALRQAQTNYNKKLNEEIANASKDASADVAQFMCQKIAENAGVVGTETVSVNSALAAPYAISYEVGAGLDVSKLLMGGEGKFQSHSDNGSGIDKEVTSLFNRETRTCHVCTTVSTRSCTRKGGSLFHRSKNTCDTKTDGPNCEDIQM